MTGIKDRIGKTLKRGEGIFYDQLQKRHYLKFYTDVCEKAGIENVAAAGEKEWIKKWSGMRLKPQPLYYRLFSRYDGHDINICPEDICRTSIEPCLNESRFIKFYADKNIWDTLFPEGTFPPTVLRCMNGIFYDKNYKRIDTGRKAVLNILKGTSFDKLIIKPSRDSNSSQGVHSMARQNGAFVLDTGAEFSVSSIVKLEGKNFIIQPFMEQHDSVSKFCSTAVNPIRISTYKSVKDDTVHVLGGGVLRIGFEGEENDGTHGNGVFAGIEDDGTLKHRAVDFYGREKKRFNGIDFEEKHVIPNFDQIKKTAVSIAERVMHTRLLAFDIMLDRQGEPVVLEFNNSAYSMWLAQFTGASAFGKFTDEIIEYTRKHCRNIEHTRFY